MLIVCCVSALSNPPHGHYVTPGAAVLDSNGVLTVVAIEDLEKLPSNTAPPIRCVLLMSPKTRTVGLVAPAFTRENFSLTIHSANPTLSTMESSYARMQFAILLRSGKWSAYQHLAPHVALGDGTLWTPNYWYILHDLLFALVLTALLLRYARSMILRHQERHRERRVLARIRAGLCPTCTYNLTALRATTATNCPECGTPIPSVDAKLPIG